MYIDAFRFLTFVTIGTASFGETFYNAPHLPMQGGMGGVVWLNMDGLINIFINPKLPLGRIYTLTAGSVLATNAFQTNLC